MPIPVVAGVVVAPVVVVAPLPAVLSELLAVLI